MHVCPVRIQPPPFPEEKTDFCWANSEPPCYRTSKSTVSREGALEGAENPDVLLLSVETVNWNPPLPRILAAQNLDFKPYEQ